MINKPQDTPELQKSAYSLSRCEPCELKHPFPLLQDLFAFAQENRIQSYGYGDENVTNHSAIPLPEKFKPLVAGYPGEYFIVSYEDRRSSYYAEGTRFQSVKVSTVKSRFETDERIREIDFTQPYSSRADRIEVRVRESVKDKSFKDINLARGEELDEPSGSARYTYELNENGNKYPKNLDLDRLDEGLFMMGGEAKPVRWIKTLSIKKQEEGPDQMEYNDYYLIRKDADPAKQTRANVKTTISEDIDKPISVLVEVGDCYGPDTKVVVNDQINNVQFLLHSLLHGENPLNILKDDPAYAPLFEKSPDTQTFVQRLRFRIQGIMEEWDKPQSIYQVANGLEKSPLKLKNNA